MNQESSSVPAYRGIKEIEFETVRKISKGMVTEDSVLIRLSSFAVSEGLEILRRVSPPYESKVNKCDAIVFADAGIFLVEVMRYGGAIKFLNEKRRHIYIEYSGYTKKVSNPVIAINKKIKLLTIYIQGSYYWKSINQLYKDEKVFDSIPVFAVLCFGPSTKIKKSYYNEDKILVCNSRNILSRLRKFIDEKPRVIGTSKMAKKIAIRWRTRGKLTVAGKAGFLKCAPIKVFGKTANLIGLTKISGLRGYQLELTYEDETSFQTDDIESIIFRYFKKNQTGDVIVDSDSTFIWTN